MAASQEKLTSVEVKLVWQIDLKRGALLPEYKHCQFKNIEHIKIFAAKAQLASSKRSRDLKFWTDNNSKMILLKI